jgi:hypothetical protein
MTWTTGCYWHDHQHYCSTLTLDVWLSGIGVTTQPKNPGFEPLFSHKCWANPTVPAAISKVAAVMCCCSNGWSWWIFPGKGDPSWLLHSTDFLFYSHTLYLEQLQVQVANTWVCTRPRCSTGRSLRQQLKHVRTLQWTILRQSRMAAGILK